MNISEFIKDNEVEFTNNLVSIDFVDEVEKEIKVKFGGELIKYIIKYGFLAYKHIELYGINSNQKIESDMVKQTVYLHEYFPKTAAYIALENIGDGNYAIVSSEDEVLEYSTEYDSLSDTGLKVFAYILKRFQEIEKLSV